MILSVFDRENSPVLKFPWLQKLVLGILFLYFCSFQIEHHLSKTLFDVAVFMGYLLILSQHHLLFDRRSLKLFSVTALLFAGVTVVSSALHDSSWFNEQSWRILYGVQAITLIPLLRFIRFDSRFFFITIGLSALACGVYALGELWVYGESHRVGGSKAKPIVFGNMALLMGLVSIAAYDMFYKDKSRWLRVLPVAALLAGVIVSLLSASRGGWLFLPVAALLFIMLFRHLPSFRRMFVVVTSLVFLLVVFIGCVMPEKMARVSVALKEIPAYFNAEKEGEHLVPSTIRFELWKESWHAFQQSPVLGIGPASLGMFLDQRYEDGEISGVVARYQHGHNQYIHALATTGLFGFFATMALFFVPLICYLKRLRKAADEQLAVLAAGCLVSLGYMVFCLTDSFFFVPETFVYYMVLQVILLSLMEMQRKPVNVDSQEANQ